MEGLKNRRPLFLTTRECIQDIVLRVMVVVVVVIRCTEIHESKKVGCRLIEVKGKCLVP